MTTERLIYSSNLQRLSCYGLFHCHDWQLSSARHWLGWTGVWAGTRYHGSSAHPFTNMTALLYSIFRLLYRTVGRKRRIGHLFLFLMFLKCSASQLKGSFASSCWAQVLSRNFRKCQQHSLHRVPLHSSSSAEWGGGCLEWIQDLS